MSRADEVDAYLDELYAKVPDAHCKGLCTDACGPIGGGRREMVRIRRAGVALPSHSEAVRVMYTTPGNYQCPALKDGRCSVYDVRPMICRVWGAAEDLECPYGCGPERLLTRGEAQALLDAARKAGTIEEPITPEDFEAMLRKPGAFKRYRQVIQPPVATRPIPPKGTPGKFDEGPGPGGS